MGSHGTAPAIISAVLNQPVYSERHAAMHAWRGGSTTSEHPNVPVQAFVGILTFNSGRRSGPAWQLALPTVTAHACVAARLQFVSPSTVYR